MTRTCRWRESRFAIALREEDSDPWRLHSIMAKYYTAGGSSLLDRWI